MMNKRFFILFLFLIFSSKLFAQAPVVFNGTDNMVIGEHVAVLEDKDNKLNIHSVVNAPGFVDSKTQVPNLQLSKSSFWLRFSITNQSNEDHLLLSLEYPTLNICDFY